MHVYVETNFILETALSQEQYQSCEVLLQMSTAGQIVLAVPAYCVAESYETIIRRSKSRQALSEKFNVEVNQLTRSTQYQSELENLKNITAMLIKSIEEDKNRLHHTIKQILSFTDIIPLETKTLNDSLEYQQKFRLTPQDAIVYASVTNHITSYNITESCFINRNSKDFNNPDIVEALKQQNCKMFTQFHKGLSYVRSRPKP